MAICGIYEQGGLVCVEDDVHGISTMSWRQAMERCLAIQQAEYSRSSKKRDPKTQKQIEQTIAAAVAARKKEQPGWEPPSSVLGFTLGVAPGRIIVPG